MLVNHNIVYHITYHSKQNTVKIFFLRFLSTNVSKFFRIACYSIIWDFFFQASFYSKIVLNELVAEALQAVVTKAREITDNKQTAWYGLGHTKMFLGG